MNELLLIGQQGKVGREKPRTGEKRQGQKSKSIQMREYEDS